MNQLPFAKLRNLVTDRYRDESNACRITQRIVAVALALLLPIVTLLSTVPLAAQDAEGTEEAGEAFAIYASEELSLSFEYPADWILTESTEDPRWVLVESSEACLNEYSGFFSDISKLCGAVVIATGTAEELGTEEQGIVSDDPAEMLSLLLFEDSDFLAKADVQTAPASLDINGQAAATGSYTYSSAHFGLKMIGYITVLIHNEQFALLLGFTPINAQEEFAPQIEMIRDSIILAWQASSPTPTPTPTVVAVSVDVDARDTRTHKIYSDLLLQSIISSTPIPMLEHFVTVKGTGDIVLRATLKPDTPQIRRQLSWEADGATITSPAVGSDKLTAKISRDVADGMKIPVRIKIGSTTSRNSWCGLSHARSPLISRIAIPLLYQGQDWG